MGKPLMVQSGDFLRIEALRGRLGIDTKIDVVRAGLDLLEREADRLQRIQQWKKAANAVSASSKEINREFRKHSRLKRT